MRQLQKGNQAAQRSDCRRNWFSRVLILRTLWKTDHRVPEETQASSAQDDRVAAPSDSSRNNGPRLTGTSFSSPFSHGRKRPPAQAVQLSKTGHSRLANFFASASSAPP